jgi:peptide/nickel transport system permease protein
VLKILRDLFRYNREFALGAFLVLIVAGMAVASFFSPYPDGMTYLVPPDVPPSWPYVMGTSSRGQDIFWELTTAIRNSLLFGLLVALLSRMVALVVGLVAGYVGGMVDRVLMSINDTFVVFPPFPILVRAGRRHGHARLGL